MGSRVLMDPDVATALRGVNIWLDTMGYPTMYLDGKKIRLHRWVMKPPDGILVDHINRIRADCRRVNLRLVGRTENAINSKMRSHNTSGFRGVHLCKITGRWRASIRVEGKARNLGRFDTPIEAAGVYDKAAEKFHGEFAVTNHSLGLMHHKIFTDATGNGIGRGCD